MTLEEFNQYLQDNNIFKGDYYGRLVNSKWFLSVKVSSCMSCFKNLLKILLDLRLLVMIKY